MPEGHEPDETTEGSLPVAAAGDAGADAHLDTQRFREWDFGVVSSFTVRRSPDSVEVEGPCPQCRGETRMAFSYGYPGGAGGLERWRRRKDSAPPQLGPTTVYCVCGYGHPGRPEESDEQGCGALWLVEL